MAIAASGISRKFASSARKTSLLFRSGARICPTVRLEPTASMLDTTKHSVAIGTALLKSSMVSQTPALEVVAAAGVVTFALALILARFLQKFARLSVPPNKVVKIVESAIRMWPARASFGGIQMKELNSVLPAALKGWGRSRSTAWRARTWTEDASPLVTA